MVDGFKLHAGFFDRAAQEKLVGAVRLCLRDAPLYTPAMPRSGKEFSVRMSNAGPLGWVSDREGGYRYQPHHPATGRPWPPIPDLLLQAWEALSGYRAPPEACLINWYGPGARMGLHRDSDEQARDAPVLSVSLGDTAVFRIGGAEKGAKTGSLRLNSGDVAILDGAARESRHGVDRILPGTSTLLDAPGRINLTLRRVTIP
ncbi:MAG: alpha-ketoglutarate-dependent dioxygenase AlkB [Pseudomonadota bacterium]|jgi:alkylated DNA repair protein (DNA oxidative demethylase)|nr:alpha-ketoglutarate-dependent dioxygenase AlkB [Pseudomonadota bacterium]